MAGATRIRPKQGGSNDELRPMAVESDGVPDMVSGDDQPIDLSRTPRKPSRVMPPLIPIKLLRAGYSAQQVGKPVKATEIMLASLIKKKSEIKSVKDVRSKCNEDIPNRPKLVAVVRQKTDVDDEKDEDANEDGDEDEDGEVLPKRVRLANGAEASTDASGDGGSGERWQRLDRARSVPQLTPLPLPLLRSKSLSESRIPAAAAGSTRHARYDATAANLLLRSHQLHSPPPDDLRVQLQAEAAAALCGAGAGARAGAAEGALRDASTHMPASAPFNNSWIYVGYYSQLLHRFQAQEFLRQLALQHQQDAQTAQKADPASGSKSAIPVPEEESVDIRRRQARPLTGKHVRPGTGASPATLLTLRRKIQARQQQHDLKQVLE